MFRSSLLVPALMLVLIVPNPTPPQSEPKTQSYAQAIGTTCQTVVGICPASPAPVGSVCACGVNPGFIRQ